MSYMFDGAIRFDQSIGSWNTGAVTTMEQLFLGAKAFNQPIGTWNTASVSDMVDMFYGATAFNRPLARWNTSGAQDMRGMFYAALKFNQPLGTWNTTHVRNLSNMFGHGSRLSTSNYNQLLIGWAKRPQTHNVHFGAGTSTYSRAARETPCASRTAGSSLMVA